MSEVDELERFSDEDTRVSGVYASVNSTTYINGDRSASPAALRPASPNAGGFLVRSPKASRATNNGCRSPRLQLQRQRSSLNSHTSVKSLSPSSPSRRLSRRNSSSSRVHSLCRSMSAESVKSIILNTNSAFPSHLVSANSETDLLLDREDLFEDEPTNEDEIESETESEMEEGELEEILLKLRQKSFTNMGNNTNSNPKLLLNNKMINIISY
jgi:hypothetical protein